MAIERILVPLDGSSLAERALPYATKLARFLNARLELARAVLPNLAREAEPSSEEIEAADRARPELEAVARELRTPWLRVTCHVCYGRPAEAIVACVSRVSAGLIVMSTHGRGGIGRWIYGSVADEILRRSPVPILLVPASSERAFTDDPICRILVPLDGSALAEEALGPASELAGAAEAELLLVRIVELPVIGEVSPYLMMDPKAELARAREYLNDIARDLRSGGLAVDVYAVTGAPPTTLPFLASERDADLIVMATHGRGGLARLVLGSVATSTVQRSTLPILLTRPAAVRRPATERSSEPATVA
ncbi:MAG: universal stress protein [Chloroflexi bacterium]|nr:universal stress protein [Chloroflexota bacterium]